MNRDNTDHFGAICYANAIKPDAIAKQFSSISSDGLQSDTCKVIPSALGAELKHERWSKTFEFN